jgi:hypothetical protein
MIYAVINAAFVPTLYFMFPETAGLSLEEMDKVFLHVKDHLLSSEDCSGDDEKTSYC